MTDYTPATEDVPEDDHTLTEAIKKLAVWAACQSDESRGIEAAEEAFDRWHADEIRKAKAQAWDEGAEATAMTVPEALWHTLGLSLPPNPYTEES